MDNTFDFHVAIQVWDIKWLVRISSRSLFIMTDFIFYFVFLSFFFFNQKNRSFCFTFDIFSFIWNIFRFLPQLFFLQIFDTYGTNERTVNLSFAKDWAYELFAQMYRMLFEFYHLFGLCFISCFIVNKLFFPLWRREGMSKNGKWQQQRHWHFWETFCAFVCLFIFIHVRGSKFALTPTFKSSLFVDAVLSHWFDPIFR